MYSHAYPGCTIRVGCICFVRYIRTVFVKNQSKISRLHSRFITVSFVILIGRTLRPRPLVRGGGGGGTFCPGGGGGGGDSLP